MKISTLICVHSTTLNNDRLLSRAASSIVSQTRKPDEVIVVLDECWPGTRDALSGLEDHIPEVKLLEKPKKEGLAVAKNFGLEHVTGDYVTYCDADDEWFPCKLEVQLAYHAEAPVHFQFTEAWDRCEDGNLRPNCFRVGQYRTNLEIAQALTRENVLAHGTAMIFMEAIKALGGYPIGRQHLGREDWSLWQLASNRGFSFFKVPERLYCYSLNTSVPR